VGQRAREIGRLNNIECLQLKIISLHFGFFKATVSAMPTNLTTIP
jgi:hypothetical protein